MKIIGDMKPEWGLFLVVLVAIGGWWYLKHKKKQVI